MTASATRWCGALTTILIYLCIAKAKRVLIRPEGATHTEAAKRLYDEGRLDAAIEEFEKAVKLHPRGVEPRAYLGSALLRKGTIEASKSPTRANGLLEQAVRVLEVAGRMGQNEPRGGAVHVDLGMALKQLNRTSDAIQALRRAEVCPAVNSDGHRLRAMARFNLLQMLKTTEDFEAAITVGEAYVEAKVHHIEDEDSMLEVAADVLDMRTAIGALRNTRTVRFARRCTQLLGATEHAQLLHRLSYAFKENWLMEEMGSVLQHKLRLERHVLSEEQALQAGQLKVPRQLHKLEHDIEQFEHLASHGMQTARMRGLAGAYRKVFNTMKGAGGGTLNRDDFIAVQSTMNRLVHNASAPRVQGPALNPDLDWAALQEEYFSQDPGVLTIDNFLTPGVLEAVRRFCLEATVWFDSKSRYLGAYHVDGFSTPLLWQIGEELAKRMPRIFKDYELTTFWAYKYGTFDEGIRVHADAAKVNVNWWVSPSEANLDAQSGGLVIFTREAPMSWDFAMYNNERFEAERDEFLRYAHNVTVPHLQNRAVVFNSNLFHKTDRMRFKPGYTNRRINITFLYGKRGGAQGHSRS